MKIDNSGPSHVARVLGFGGLIPFVGLAVALWLMPPAGTALIALALLGYGVSIVSFLGAIHWGLAMQDGAKRVVSSTLWGVVPSLLGWVALLIGDVVGLMLIAALLLACYGVDRAIYPRHQLQRWLPMRWSLTLVASLSCIAGATALLR